MFELMIILYYELAMIAIRRRYYLPFHTVYIKIM